MARLSTVQWSLTRLGQGLIRWQKVPASLYRLSHANAVSSISLRPPKLTIAHWWLTPVGHISGLKVMALFAASRRKENRTPSALTLTCNTRYLTKFFGLYWPRGFLALRPCACKTRGP